VVRHFTTAAERVLPRAAPCHANRRPQLERYVIAVRCKKSDALELRRTRPKLMLVFSPNVIDQSGHRSAMARTIAG
jgi:hypothetical protein